MEDLTGVREKQRIAKSHCKDNTQYKELKFQISVCHELGRDIPDGMIKELAAMLLMRMRNVIRLYKFA